MKFKNPYWTNKTKIELLSRWIAVHCIAYYELDNNVVSDEMFDNNVKQLKSIASNDPKSFKLSSYYKVFKSVVNNNSVTGFDIPKKLKKLDPALYEELYSTAFRLIDRFAMKPSEAQDKKIT